MQIPIASSVPIDMDVAAAKSNKRFTLTTSILNME